jgi:hypothetical protein
VSASSPAKGSFWELSFSHRPTTPKKLSHKTRAPHQFPKANSNTAIAIQDEVVPDGLTYVAIGPSL